YFPEADSEFKVTPERSWDASYGDDGGGKISLSATGNIKAPRAGNLELTVNTNDNTISFKDHRCGRLGEATVRWYDDTDMCYENSTQLCKITAELTVGEMKTRKAHDWRTTYGGVNGKLTDYDIAITDAGTDEVVLDLINEEYS